jgi:hypothetical protein
MVAAVTSEVVNQCSHRTQVLIGLVENALEVAIASIELDCNAFAVLSAGTFAGNNAPSFHATLKIPRHL